MSCDLLVFAPHPDDAEIHCGPCFHAGAGEYVAFDPGFDVDATRGELASRGTPGIRAREAAAAAGILGLAQRDNLLLADGAIPSEEPAARHLVIDAIRRHRPATVLCIHGHARHPDHRNRQRHARPRDRRRPPRLP